MPSCDDEKTRYTLYKTLSYVIKCIFLMCAFLFVGLFNEQDKVEAASVAFNTNNTSSCWSASGTTLKVTSNCNKYEYVVNFSHSVTNGSVTSIEEFYVNVGSTSYGGQMYTQSGSGQKMRCRGSKVKNINLTITYSSSATSVTYSSSFTRTTLKICTSMGTDNNVSITIPTSQLSYSLTLKAKMKVSYKKAGSGVESPSSTISIVDAAPPTVPTVISNSSGGNWSSSDVYIKVGNSTDFFKGVSYYQYSYDKNNWHNDIDGYCTAAGAASYNNSSGACGSWRAERNDTVYFRAVDAAGNASGASSGTKVKIDKTAPSSTVSVANPSGGNWTNQDVTLTLTGGADTGTYQSGFSKYQYSYDKSSWHNDWSTTGATTKGVWSAERNNTVYFRVVDVAGNVSGVSSSTTAIKIDKTSPGQPSVSNSSGGSWTNQNVTITVSGGADTGTYQSGFSKYQYSTNNSSWSNTVTSSFTTEMDGTRYYRACDAAGNCGSSKSTTIRIDKTSPGQPSLSNSSGGSWTNQNVTITVSGGADTGTYKSGFSKYQYSTDNSTWSNTVTSSFTTEMDGTRYYRACDAAGNCGSSKSTTIRIDKTSPGQPSLSNSSSGSWTNQNVTITVSGGADTGTYKSGFSKYQYSTNNSSWSNSLTTEFSSEQNSTYYYRACDAAGNCGSSKSTTIRIDKTNPSGTISVSNTSGGNWTNQNVTVTVRGATDPLSNGVSSGLKQYDWTSGSGWNKFYTQSSITDQTNGYAAAIWSSETDITLTPRVCDNAGNCLTGTTTTKVRIDKTKPITNVTIDKTTSTAILHFTDNKSISDNNSKLGSSFEYYLSNKSDVDVASLKDSQWIELTGDVQRGTGNDKMHIGRDQHYLYIKIPNDITDTAGNTVRDPYSTAISGYTVIKTTVTGSSTTPITFANINSKARTGVQNTGNYVVEIIDNFVIVTFDSEATLPNGFTMKTINEVLKSAGYRLISVEDSAEFDFESSSLYVTLIGNDAVGSLSTQNDIYQLMVLINAPTTSGGNTGARVLEQGEELGNIAVSFTSDIEFSVDTLITLNGVKVKEVDTNKPGVYEVRSIATDVMGRVNKVSRTIVVKEGVKEEVKVNVEKIKETPEIIASAVVNNAPVEVQPETNANRKVVENIQVEMIIENKEEVKGYKKKEEKNKKNKENKGTFKLFSKWFFKVYDG